MLFIESALAVMRTVALIVESAHEQLSIKSDSDGLHLCKVLLIRWMLVVKPKNGVSANVRIALMIQLPPDTGFFECVGFNDPLG